MSDNMHDLSGWVEIPCVDSDELRSNMIPVSGLTDLSGRFGTPVVYTEWADTDEKPALRDYRWPDHPRACKHYVPEVTA